MFLDSHNHILLRYNHVQIITVLDLLTPTLMKKKLVILRKHWESVEELSLPRYDLPRVKVWYDLGDRGNYHIQAH